MGRFIVVFLVSAVISGFGIGYWRIATMPETILNASMKTATSVSAIDEQTIRAPVNQLAHSAGAYTADMDVAQIGVTAPMADMLYSVIWLDVSDEPMIVSVPDFGDRYYSISFTDIRNLNTGYIGTRVTGNGAGVYAVVSPDWNGELPDGVKRFEINTPKAQAMVRVFMAGADDFEDSDAVRRLITFTPMSQF
ncbi:MAG: DUF1254 domain-containing protein [Rhizobiales bacterium]|nr:DUF1254 domain-containing protein [Hyphomicrobiales bacterium]